MRNFVVFIILDFLVLAAVSTHAETMKLNAFHAYLRKTPEPNATVIGAVNMGDKIEILQKSSKWIKVRLSNGQTGYLWHRLLEPIMEKPVVTNLKSDVKTEVISVLKTEEKGQKAAAGDEQIPIASNVTKAIQPPAKTPVPTIVAAAAQSPAVTPVTLAPVPITDLANVTQEHTMVVPVAMATNVKLPVVATESTVVPIPTEPIVEETENHCEDMQLSGGILKKDEELKALHQEIVQLTQEKDPLRAQLERYKIAEAADINSERVYLKGVGEVDMITGAGITTIKVPVSIESKADKVFSITRSDKLVKEGYAYYSAPSTVFNW